ncbi:hypothetical protein DQ393_31205 [Rhizobium tropici]|uniref:Uncharacterized protein n=1 Tax=Rhizobium tropici TaxID=398 RepID=A0A329Y066_RHITR|nr:hypothetical protein DQ393_31205 [Rhizobium tropici]
MFDVSTFCGHQPAGDMHAFVIRQPSRAPSTRFDLAGSIAWPVFPCAVTMKILDSYKEPTTGISVPHRSYRRQWTDARQVRR